MTSFDKKPVKKVVAVTAVHGKKMDTKKQQKADQNNHSNNSQPIARVSLGYVLKLAVKVIQQQMRRLVQYFCNIARDCLCGFLEWIIVILSSIFFVTKLIFYKTESREQLNKDIKPEFLSLIEDKEDEQHNNFHVIHKLQVIEETNEVIECCKMVRHEEPKVGNAEKKCTNVEIVKTKEPETVEDCDYYGIVQLQEDTKIDLMSDEPEADRYMLPHPRKRLVRRLSNVERFYLENPKKAKSKKVKNRTKVLLSMVYMSCAFVITQFYLLITALLSTTLPSGLLFLITSLIGVATIVLQMVFPGKKKQQLKQEKRQVDVKRTRDTSVQTVDQVMLNVAPINGKQLRPIQKVHPFMLRKLSSQEIWQICRAQSNIDRPAIQNAPVVY